MEAVMQITRPGSGIQRQLEMLRERNKQLEALLGQALFINPKLKLSRNEEKTTLALYARDRLPKDGMYQLLYGDMRESDQPGPKVLDVLIFLLRRKLRRRGIRIETLHGFGYMMSTESKARLRVFVVRTRAAVQP